MKNDIKNLLIYILTFFVLSAIGMMNTNAADFGDISGNGKIDAADASMILAKYAEFSTDDTEISDEELSIYDINRDKVLNSADASCVLGYYAYISTDGKENLEYFVQNSMKSSETSTEKQTSETITTTTTKIIRGLYPSGTAIELKPGGTTTWKCKVVGFVALEFETPSENIILPDRIECDMAGCEIEVPVSCKEDSYREDTRVQVIMIDENGGRHPYGKSYTFQVFIDGTPTEPETGPAVYPDRVFTKLFKGTDVKIVCVVCDATEICIESDNNELSFPERIECRYPYDVCYLTFSCGDDAKEVYTEIKITPKDSEGNEGKTKILHLQIYPPISQNSTG